MVVWFCFKHNFCPVNGTLLHCQAQNGHQGCIRLGLKEVKSLTGLSLKHPKVKHGRHGGYKDSNRTKDTGREVRLRNIRTFLLDDKTS